MNTTLPEASALLQDVQECISRQQKLADTLEALGHPKQAGQAREMLATWVKSWLSLAVELENTQAFLDALGDLPDEGYTHLQRRIDYPYLHSYRGRGRNKVGIIASSDLGDGFLTDAN